MRSWIQTLSFSSYPQLQYLSNMWFNKSPRHMKCFMFIIILQSFNLYFKFFWLPFWHYYIDNIFWMLLWLYFRRWEHMLQVNISFFPSFFLWTYKVVYYFTTLYSFKFLPVFLPIPMFSLSAPASLEKNRLQRDNQIWANKI